MCLVELRERFKHGKTDKTRYYRKYVLSLCHLCNVLILGIYTHHNFGSRVEIVNGIYPSYHPLPPRKYSLKICSAEEPRLYILRNEYTGPEHVNPETAAAHLMVVEQIR